LKLQSRNLEIGIKKKSLGVMNEEKLLTFVDPFLGYHNLGFEWALTSLWLRFAVSDNRCKL